MDYNRWCNCQGGRRECQLNVKIGLLLSLCLGIKYVFFAIFVVFFGEVCFIIDINIRIHYHFSTFF